MTAFDINQSLMILGTSSSAGKSLLTLAICRHLNKKKVSVTPFKPLNIAALCNKTNSLAIADAQYQQAYAAGAAPSPRMSPVIIECRKRKPNIILLGESSSEYIDITSPKQVTRMKRLVSNTYKLLLNEYDYVIVEGSGACLELNYRRSDFSNMWFAKKHNTPCILVCNFDKGGGFASLLGTLKLMTPKERSLVSGFVVNMMQYPSNFTEGRKILESKLKRPCLGVIPPYENLSVWNEDGDKDNDTDLSLSAIDGWTKHVMKHSDLDNFLSKIRPMVQAKIREIDEDHFC